MRPLTASCLVVAACGYPPLPKLAENPSDDDAGTDARLDAMPDAPNLCFGSYVRVCFDTAMDIPTTPAPLPADLTIEVDTESSPLCNQANSRKNDFCVIAGSTVTLVTGQSLRAFGTKPLVLLATTTIVLSGALDAGSNRNPGGALSLGAGANPVGMCAGLTEAGGNSGGYGGSFHGQGGTGSSQDGTAGTPSAAMASFPPSLRGGCPGGSGSTTRVGTGVPGLGGSGGGAVALVAAMSIRIDGEIRASGSGGRGGSGNESGGGGGGSGGMVVLETPSLIDSVGGRIIANGGGGGQGGAPQKTTPGDNNGQDGGESTAPMTAGMGGLDSNKDGGTGGNGSTGVLAGRAGSQGVGNGGGGAGGGGAGFVHAPGVATGRVSPASQDLPPSS
jgi:hypothetical protein